MNSKKTDFVSKDIISSLPEALICHILSFLPTEEAALTSVLSKKWRYLFAFTPNLEFDNSEIELNPDVGNRKRCFTDFVDRVLDLHGNSAINRFFLDCGNRVDPACVNRWILDVLERGVSDLDLRDSSTWNDVIPSKLLLSKSLVRLRVEDVFFSSFDVEDVFLPKLKTLHFNNVVLGNNDNCFTKLISGCPVLEELVAIHVFSNFCNHFVSSKTLKRLTFYCSLDYNKNPQSVSFDTPNLRYLVYCYPIAEKYPKVNFHSLVEASIGLQITYDQYARVSNGDMVGNATDFLMGIRNVRILNLFGRTLEVLALCCKPIPAFNNLIHLTLKTDCGLTWESLPTLLKSSPNLETLVFQGLHHKDTTKCKDADGCLCKYSNVVPTCLSSSPVKVLKILSFGELCNCYDMEKQVEQAKFFLETMPNLEEMILYFDTPTDEDMIEVSKQLQMHPRVASRNCNVQLISDNLTLSSTIATNGNPLV